MPDFALEWGGDLQLSPTAGVELVSGSLLTRQRLIRRLLTNPGDYIWDLTYGAGLGLYVGRPMNNGVIQGLVMDQALLEDTVASVEAVTVSLVTVSTYTVTVAYTETASPGAVQVLALPVQ